VKTAHIFEASPSLESGAFSALSGEAGGYSKPLLQANLRAAAGLGELFGLNKGG